jgi:hypothetical protein
MAFLGNSDLPQKERGESHDTPLLPPRCARVSAGVDYEKEVRNVNTPPRTVRFANLAIRGPTGTDSLATKDHLPLAVVADASLLTDPLPLASTPWQRIQDCSKTARPRVGFPTICQSAKAISAKQIIPVLAEIICLGWPGLPRSGHQRCLRS